MDSMYDDAGPEGQQTQSGGPPAEGQQEEHSQGKSALLNSEVCPGMEVGDYITLKITGVKEGEYVVEYEKEGGGEGGEQPPMEGQEPPMDNGDSMYG